MRHNHALFRFLAFVFVLAAASALVKGAEAPKGALVLDESAYWRTYFVFAPDRIDSAALKAEGGAVLDAAQRSALEKKAKRYFNPPFADPGDKDAAGLADWQDEALFFITQVKNCGCADEPTWRRIYAPPPPANWVAPDFDDSPWFRQRLPMMMGNFWWRGRMHGDVATQSGVRVACYRTTFPVADPAADYVLSLSFRGGARVFLNGREIGRANLPNGELDAIVPAAGYPQEAYICLDGERPAAAEKNIVSNLKVNYCQDLPGTWEVCYAALSAIRSPKLEKAPDILPWSEGYSVGDKSLTRKCWDRITPLRNRTLGPIALPKALLKAGANLLAVEIRTSDLHPIVAKGVWPRGGMNDIEFYWPHCRLLDISLRASAAATPTALARPAGIQVWAEDIHRCLFSPDFGPSGVPGTVTFVGGWNGVYNAQLAVGTDRDLAGLKLTASELRGPAGAMIPSAALAVRQLAGHPTTELVRLGQIRNFPEHRRDPLCPPAEMALLRLGSPEAKAQTLPREKRLAEIEAMQFFDHIAPGLTGKVPAGTCQPVWLTLTIPPGSAPGTYRGAVVVQADGMPPVSVPVVAEVVGWRVPDSRDFQTVMALEQSPYGVAKQYKTPLWSDEHFKFMEASFRQLARAGDDWLFIPIIQNTEFGNAKKEPMIPWLRRRDGTMAFDYRSLDRYLDIATREKLPRVICFVVMAGGTLSNDAQCTEALVAVTDEATGRNEVLDLSYAYNHRDAWKAFALSLYQHMRARGLEDRMYWGFGWDNDGNAGLMRLLAEFLPNVKWARGAHTTGQTEYTKAFARIYGVQLPPRSAKGWKNPLVDLLLPRSGCSILSCNGHSPPFAFRLMVDRSVVAGLSGVGRLGADYWDESYFEGAKSPSYAPGMPCVAMLWPGAEGAEPSTRFEVLREGLQETEARIFVEQALDANLLPAELAARAGEALYQHNRETLYLSVGTVSVQAHEYSTGWQERSRRVYRIAAEAAAAVPLDVDKPALTAAVPAGNKITVPLRLRNWTGTPRVWRIRGIEPWLVPDRAEGTLDGQEAIGIVVDGAGFKPGDTAKGRVAVTDVAAARTMEIEITARVERSIEFDVGRAYDLGSPGYLAYEGSAGGGKRVDDYAVFNVATGGAESREFSLVNRFKTAAAFKIQSSAPWLAAEPAAGTLGPGEGLLVKVSARPPDTSAATHEATLTVSEPGGPGTQTVRLVVHVIPPYAAPAGLPKGDPVWLADLPKSAVKAHQSRRAYNKWGMSDRNSPDFGPEFDKDKSIVGGAEQTTVYNLEGSGFTAFSAKAFLEKGGVHISGRVPNWRRVDFEVRVDGRLRAQTGLMGAGEPPRLLVVDALDGAKEIELKVRFDTPEARNLLGIPLIQWQEPKFYKAASSQPAVKEVSR